MTPHSFNDLVKRSTCNGRGVDNIFIGDGVEGSIDMTSSFKSSTRDEISTEALWEIFSPANDIYDCLLYTSPSPRDATLSRMPSSA